MWQSLSRYVSRFSAMTLIGILALPASTNYKLQGFGFGSGGTADSNSTNYRLNAITGEVSDDETASANYVVGPGLNFTQQADVPPAPSFTNPENYYDKLLLVIAPGPNPSDALFAVAISDDDFVTTEYVQSDGTVGATLGSEDYQTYAAWGGGSGENVIGLEADTTYKVKVKAMHGDFTETGYSATATAATVSPQLTFDIDVSATDTDTSPPYTIALSDLTAGSVITSAEKIWVDLSTNGNSGGTVYVVGSNAGLQSSHTAYTIASASANLTAASEGFGAQGSTATQSSGGPFSIAAAYNLSSENVGVTDTTIRDIFTTANPITAGRGSFLVKAKSSSVTPAAADYTETLTLIAAALF
ncbi:MAG: hypothetical protein WD972_00235 [Candidatus Andersenbacteria bacterium]